jgi:hypothetical protein
MAASNAQRFLQVEGAGDERAIALKMFWGIVIETFRQSTDFWDNTGNIVAHKDISAGKEWQFPVIGADPTPEYHTPGTELLGQVVEMTEGTVTIDDILVAHYDIPIDQIVLSHFDVMAPYARKLGRAIALQVDLNILITALKAARHQQLLQSDAATPIHNGGNRVNGGVPGDLTTAYTTNAAGAANFRDDAANLAQLMDEDNVPEAGRNLFIHPYIRRVLGSSTVIFDSDLNRNPSNDLNNRVIGRLEGFDVRVTNRLPSSALATGPAKYQANFAFDSGAADLEEGWSDKITNDGRPAAVAMCGAMDGMAAVGFVSAGGIVPHIEDDHRRNTKFLKAQIMCGAGVMAPWCAGEIYVDN